MDATGTITTYTPGTDYLSFRTTTSAEPVKYYYSPKETVLVDSEGATVDWKYLRADMPVKYTYVKEGDRMIVRKITLQKPVSYYEKETTTTTTTTKP
jgi:predicted Zn-dependent protease